MQLRALFAATLISSAAFSAAGTFTLPHIIEKNGVIVGVAWSPSGGQPGIAIDESGPSKPKHRPVTFSTSLYENFEVYKWIGLQLMGTDATTSFTMYPVEQGNAFKCILESFSLRAVSFPACDSDSKEQRMVLTSGQPVIVNNEKGLAIDFKTATQTVKHQKTWQCSNYRLTIPGLPTDKVISTESLDFIRVAAGDVNGDGTPDLVYQPSDFVFTVPQVDAPAYQKIYQSSLSGRPVLLDIKLEYLDDNGNQLIGLIFQGELLGMGPDNMFGDPTSPRAVAQERIKLRQGIKVEIGGKVATSL